MDAEENTQTPQRQSACLPACLSDSPCFPGPGRRVSRTAAWAEAVRGPPPRPCWLRSTHKRGAEGETGRRERGVREEGSEAGDRRRNRKMQEEKGEERGGSSPFAPSPPAIIALAARPRAPKPPLPARPFPLTRHLESPGLQHGLAPGRHVVDHVPDVPQLVARLLGGLLDDGLRLAAVQLGAALALHDPVGGEEEEKGGSGRGVGMGAGRGGKGEGGSEGMSPHREKGARLGGAVSGSRQRSQSAHSEPCPPSPCRARRRDSQVGSVPPHVPTPPPSEMQETSPPPAA